MPRSSDLIDSFNEIDYLSRSILLEFKKSPHINVFYVNKDCLIYYSQTFQFSKNSWEMNPFQYCFDQYKKQYFYPIILAVNNLPSMYQFKYSMLKNGIITPTSDIIKSISNYIHN